jgi:hypothetical protein
MNQPFRITIEHYDQRVCVEVDHSDVSAAEAVELFQRAMRAAGFDYVNVRIDDATDDVNHDVDGDHEAPTFRYDRDAPTFRHAYLSAADALLGGNIAREFFEHANKPAVNIGYKPQRGEIVEVSNDAIEWETRVFGWYDGKLYHVPMTHRDEIKMHKGDENYTTHLFKYCRKLDGEMFSYT